MDLQSIINFILPVVCTVLGWFCRELWSAVQDLKRDLARLREELPTNYIAKSEFNERWIEVLKALRRLEDKIDNIHHRRNDD